MDEKKGKKMPRGKPFEKGHPGGPGAPKLPDEVKKLAGLTKKEALALLGEMLQKPMVEVEAVLADKSRKAFDHITAAIVTKSVDGNSAYLKEMLDRLYGKVKEELQISVKPKIIHNLDGGGATLSIEGNDE